LDTNLLVTTHNSCVWLSALCHLTGVVLSLRTRQGVRMAGLWLPVAYTLAAGAVAVVAMAAYAHWTPIFFVQGREVHRCGRRCWFRPL